MPVGTSEPTYFSLKETPHYNACNLQICWEEDGPDQTERQARQAPWVFLGHTQVTLPTSVGVYRGQKTWYLQSFSEMEGFSGYFCNF